MMAYADFVKPTSKVELMRIRQKSRSDPFVHQHAFVPQCLLRDFDLKLMPERNDAKEPAKRVFVRKNSVFKSWRVDKTRDFDEMTELDF